MDSPDTKPVLEYSTRRLWREHWVARRWMAIPPWLIALVGFTLLWFGEKLFDFVDSVGGHLLIRSIYDCLVCILICAAGALQRLRLRDVLVMSALGALVFVIDLNLSGVTKSLPPAAAWLVWPLLMILPAAAVETSLAPRHKLPAILLAVLLSFGAACLCTLILNFLALSESPFDIDWLKLRQYRWGYIIANPLFIVSVWLVVVPVSRRMANGLQIVLGSTIVAAICAAYLLYFQVWIFSFALHSLKAGGPFRRSEALGVLELRDSPDDREAMWRALEEADWAKQDGYLNSDYRYYAIHCLAERDREAAVKKLSQMLAARPSAKLAGYSADLLLEAHDYDSVPILMRYALRNDEACIKALAKAKIPQVMLAILRSAVLLEAEFDAPGVYKSNFELMRSTHAELVAMAGVDVGPNVDPWFDFYAANRGTMPTPLSADQAEQTDRVEKAIVKYLGKAELGMDVPPPNWDAPGVIGLESEVEQYGKRVDEALTQHRSSNASRPSR